MDIKSVALVYRKEEKSLMQLLEAELRIAGITCGTFAYDALLTERSDGMPEKLKEYCLALMIMAAEPLPGVYPEDFLKDMNGLIDRATIPAFPLWIQNAGDQSHEEEKYFEVIFPRVSKDKLDAFAREVGRFVHKYSHNPFKGPEPYTRRDRLSGRTQDVGTLVEYIRNNTLTLLYSQSGYGKSSLLQAGLMGELEKTHVYFPVFISMRSIDKLSITEIKRYVAQGISNLTEDGKTSVRMNPAAEQAGFVLEYLYTQELVATVEKKEYVLSPVLIFDQFEELFTRPSIKADEFFEELSYILEKTLPPDVVKILRTGGDNPKKEAYRNLVEKITSREIPYRVLFSFRQEYLISLEQFRNTIPSLIYTSGKFRLDGFSREEAEKIILDIAGADMDKEEIAHIAQILDRVCSPGVAAMVGGSGRCISPFILSLICRELYHKIIAKNVLKDFLPPQYRIMEEDKLQWLIDNVKENYYRKCFSGLSPYTCIFVEEKLVSNEGKRTLFPYEDVISYFDGNDGYFAGKSEQEITAVNERLRQEIDLLINEQRIRYLNINSYLNTPNIEILHDQLAIPVRTSRTRREEREGKEKRDAEEGEKQLQREAEFKQLKKDLELQWQGKRVRTRGILFVVALGLFVTGLLVFFFFLSNVARVMWDFTDHDERISLQYIERSRGSYAAFLESFSYHNKLEGQIFKYSSFLLFSRERRLKDTVEGMVIDAFKKEPFFGFVAIPGTDGTSDVKLSSTGLLLALKGDSLFYRDINTFRDKFLLLKGYRETIVMNGAPSSQGLSFNMSSTGPSYLAAGSPKLVVGNSRILALAGDVLYIIRNGQWPVIVNAIRLTYASQPVNVSAQQAAGPDGDVRSVVDLQNGELENLSLNSISTDSFKVCLSMDEMTTVVTPKQGLSKSHYYMINNGDSIRKPEQFFLRQDQALLNIAADSGGHEKIIYIKNSVSRETKHGFRDFRITIRDTIRRYRYASGKWMDSTELAYGRVVYKNNVFYQEDSTDFYYWTESKRWCLRLQDEQWLAYDLTGKGIQPALYLDRKEGAPAEILVDRGDTLIIYNSLKMEVRDMRGRRMIKDLLVIDTASHVYDPGDKPLRLARAISTGTEGWFIFVVKVGSYATKMALLDLKNSTLYVFSNYLSSSGSFYKFPDKRLAFMPEADYGYLQVKSMTYWVIKDPVSPKIEFNDVKEWMKKKSKCSDTIYKQILLKSHGEN